MQAIGTDIVAIRRFNHWQHYPLKKLQRIFSANEINDSRLSCKKGYNPQSLAVRFAAKEAFFKALCSLQIQTNENHLLPPFLTICRYISIAKHLSGVPILIIDKTFYTYVHNKKLYTSVSLAHEKEYAIATVICWR